ncbi:hypothetical protein DIS24_g8939 [Lasiodiplodia hormozganensis]|uniref:Uncharacterized protein n=1 Tax=Lasiodiplodia hormozganensis TaxID=869390 RepID=A0AA39XZQ8_9PEZI|nr:hypothetical protein DIS24_g8939 [Lasiodiplodia hormozganensis]
MSNPEATDLGRLSELPQDATIQTLETYDAIMATADFCKLDDKTTADKAVQDNTKMPSVWFVNFPNKLPAEQQEKLRIYQQSILDYRCWASLIWWRNVYSRPDIGQDDEPEEIAARTAYCAKVAVAHMKKTPWLAVSQDQDLSKKITCNVKDFHTELIKAILDGFVGISEGIRNAVEKILDSLRRTISSSEKSSQRKMIVCERYEYISQTDQIRSYVRLVSFSVTESVKNVQNAKKTETFVTCEIDYNEYEATFNQRLWEKVAADIEEVKKKAAKELVDNETVDCPP